MTRPSKRTSRPSLSPGATPPAASEPVPTSAKRERTLSDVGERGLIRILETLVRPGAVSPRWRDVAARLAVGIGDDTAVWDPIPGGGTSEGTPAAPLVLATVDTMVEGTHFRSDWATWEEIGRKLVASNASDIASMGGRPTLALVSLACPPSMALRSLRRLYAGIADECRRVGAALAGGDSVRSAAVVLALTLLGEKDRDAAPCLRSVARPGQRVYVTGQPGESGAGLEWLRREGAAARRGAAWKRRLVERHLLPTARVEAASALARHLPDLAMIDISDGLDNEAGLMAAASGVEIALELERLPVSPALRSMANRTGTPKPHPETADSRTDAKRTPRESESDPLGFVLFGGEDYELLFATEADARTVARVLAEADPRLEASEIGRVARRRRGGRVTYRAATGRLVAPPRLAGRFEHFDATESRTP